MTDQGDSQIGIGSSSVHFTQRENIELVVDGNQSRDDPVDASGLVG
jgi:hypothetical protein